MSAERDLFADGHAYERTMGRWSRKVGEQFLDWLALPRGLDWLDVGCGNGAFTETLIARCAPASAFGLDRSKQQIEYARSRDPGRLAQFDVGDAQALPFDAPAFDVAVMALVISFLPDPAKGVAEMARVVRPGGWVAAYMWEVPDGLPTVPLRRIAQSLGFETAQAAPVLAASRVEGMRALWSANGLMDVETRRIDIEVTYETFEDYWQSHAAKTNRSAQFLGRLSTAELETVRNRLRRELVVAGGDKVAYAAHASAIKGRLQG